MGKENDFCLICRKNKSSLGTKTYGPYLCEECVEKANKARCPECGDSVFIPNIGWIEDMGIEVICYDMGHWMGKLSDCKGVNPCPRQTTATPPTAMSASRGSTATATPGS